MKIKSLLLTRFVFLVVGFTIFSQPLFSQGDDIFGIDRKLNSRKSENELGNIFRNMVSNISFEISGGAAYHRNYMIFNSDSPSKYPVIPTVEGTDLDLTMDDTLRFSSEQMAFPINIGARIKLFNLITLGGGYGREWGKINPLQSSPYEFQFENANYTFDKLYGTVGIVLWDAGKRISFLKWRYRSFSQNNIYMQSELKQRARQVYPWSVIAEGEFGSLFIREGYDSLITAPDPYYSLALRVEYDFSEYSKIFIRPSTSFRTFSYTHNSIPEIQNIDQTLYALQVGVSISLPGTKRCKVGGCGVVMKHNHNGVEYRGSSIWKRQNRKVGQWYGN